MSIALDNELAELRAAALAFNDRHERIHGLAWPSGHRIAVNFTVDFDAMLLRRLSNETPMQLAKGEFGGRVGIWRLIELFNSHDIKSTVFTPGRICELYPQAVVAAARSGHEIADHMWEHRVPKDADVERDHLSKATAAIERLTGERPRGTRSRHTPALLREMGYIYNSLGYSDHLPYYLKDVDGAGNLLTLPFHYAIDDAMFFSFAWLRSGTGEQRISDSERVLDLWWDGFWQQYQQGGYFNVCLHPFVSGRALRIDMLDRLIVRMKALPGVWFPTCLDVARYCLERYPSHGQAAAKQES